MMQLVFICGHQIFRKPSNFMSMRSSKFDAKVQINSMLASVTLSRDKKNIVPELEEYFSIGV
jgi:hypothetical protein